VRTTSCACQHDPKAAHGLYFLLTQKVEGKTSSRYVSVEQAPVVQRQIELGRQFRERVEAYWEACERWADEQLEAIAVSAEEAEKGGLSADLESETTQEIETLLRPQAVAELNFEAVEMAARRQALRLAARALEQRLNADTSDYVGAELPCPCGGVARYHGPHGATISQAWDRRCRLLAPYRRLAQTMNICHRGWDLLETWKPEFVPLAECGTVHDRDFV
jgi:hypothetical protein